MNGKSCLIPLSINNDFAVEIRSIRPVVSVHGHCVTVDVPHLLVVLGVFDDVGEDVQIYFGYSKKIHV